MRCWLIVSLFVIFHSDVVAFGCPPTQDSSAQKLSSLPGRYYSQIKHKLQQMEQCVNKRVEKALTRAGAAGRRDYSTCHQLPVEVIWHSAWKGCSCNGWNLVYLVKVD